MILVSFWARQKPKNKHLVISKQQLHFRHALSVVTVIIFRASRLREFPLAPITNLFYRKFTTQKTTTKSTLMLLWWWPWTKVWKICNKKQFCSSYSFKIAATTVINGDFFWKKKINWPSNLPKIFTVFFDRQNTQTNLLLRFGIYENWFQRFEIKEKSNQIKSKWKKKKKQNKTKKKKNTKKKK